jgi:hypothetical protein
MMLTVATISFAATAAWVGWHVVRRRVEGQRFGEAQDRYQRDEDRDRDDDERWRLLDLVQRQFPHAADELEDCLSGDNPSEDDVRRVLAAVPGVRIGETPNQLPVILPHSVRTRGLSCWGRTGTGKSALCLRLICDDLSAGRSLVVLGSETEFFRDHVLPKVPAERVKELIYFAPAREDCPVVWNPFDVPETDRARAALELFTVFRRVLGTESLGPQSDPIARNTFLALAGMPGASFLTAREWVESPELRARLLPKIEDRWCRIFWERTFATLGRSAARPFLNRLELFAGAAPGVRRTLCQPRSNFSFSGVIDTGGVLLVDLSGFDGETTRVLGQLTLSYLQLAVEKRQRMPEQERRLCMAYADEFHETCGQSPDTWRFLASKGRRHRWAQAVFSQFPGQVDADVRSELFGNNAVVLSLAVSAQEANFIRRELLVPSEDGAPEPVAAEELVSLPIGCAFARLGTGALAVPVRLDPPLEPGDPAWGEEVRARSWERFANQDPSTAVADAATNPGSESTGGSALTADDRRLLAAVREAPGRNSSEYAKLARMSGVAALACRRRLVAAGLIREHQIATGRRGRQAIVLEPVPEGDRS